MDINNYVEIVVKYVCKDGSIVEHKSKFLKIHNFNESFIKCSKDLILNKKINLGLDLQGGSYLLLEINSNSLIEEKIQSKIIPIKKLDTR